MPDAGVDMILRVGIGADRAAALSDLAGRISGYPVSRVPYLAPVLLFADPGLQARLPMPRPRPGVILVQEAQSVAYPAEFPLDTALAATAQGRTRGDLAELRFDLSADAGPVARLVTTLRQVPAADLGAVKPTPFRAASLGDGVQWTAPVAITQDQADGYIALSGDRNPIHHDPALARDLGLDAPIVPGLLLVSLIQPVAEATLPGAALASLKSRFLAPLCIGAPMRIGLQMRGPATGGLQRARAYLVDMTDRALAIVDLQLRVTPG
jgi:acyl dehydratase